MSDEDCIISVSPLTFLSKDPKKAFKQIKESRKSMLDKTLEKMETNPLYQFFTKDLELVD